MNKIIKKLREQGRQRLLSQQGFTLPEVLVTVFLFSIIFGACLMILFSGQEIWSVNDVQIELQSDLRVVMARMKDDLMQSGSNVITGVDATGTPQGSIIFKKSLGVTAGNTIWSADLSYSLNGDDELIRDDGTTQISLARNITGLSFIRAAAAPDIVFIFIQASKNSVKSRVINESTSFSVQLRN